MKHAIYAPTLREYADVRRLVELAQASEQSGYDGFFVWDVLFMERGASVADATVALAAIAQATSRLRIGAMITPVARRRPWKLAKELTTLDQLSNGRVILGVGLGEPADVEYGWVGENQAAKVRAERLDEGLAVLDPLLRGEAVTHAGTHYPLTDALAVPASAQSPRLPIWVGAALPAHAGIRRAARWDGLFPIVFPENPEMRDDGSFDMAQTWPSPGQFAEIVAMARDYRAALTPPRDCAGFDFVASGSTASDSEAAARDKVAAYDAVGATWWTEWLDDRAGTFDASLKLCRRGPLGPR